MVLLANFKYKNLQTSHGSVRLNQIPNYLLRQIASGEKTLRPNAHREQRPFKGVRGFEKMYRQQAHDILVRRGLVTEKHT